MTRGAGHGLCNSGYHNHPTLTLGFLFQGHGAKKARQFQELELIVTTVNTRVVLSLLTYSQAHFTEGEAGSVVSRGWKSPGNVQLLIGCTEAARAQVAAGPT